MLIRVLVVEDSETDTQLVLTELRRGGYQVDYERVETRPALQAALTAGPWDILLCDYTLPQFSALEALETVRESGLDLPFIVISGTIDEDTAVTVLRAGAHDFILKDRMARLVPAVARELEDARTRQLHRAAEQERRALAANLEAIHADLERFTYTAFHDLRAPLVTIKGFLGLVRRHLNEGQPDEARRDIQRVEAAADTMDDLLSDLLELLRIGRVAKPFEEVSLRQLVDEALQELTPLIRTRHADVTVSTPLPNLYGDRARLRLLLSHLIENAVQYTDGQPTPRIEIGVRQQDGQPVIFVRDNGQGIDPRYHNRIFNLFEKLDPSSPGTGLGLALSKRIVEVHGGRIWVESEGEGRGATFCFTLPDRRVT